MTGLITEYLGSGLAAARPATPDVPTGALAFYFATDTEALSMYDQNDGAWQTTGGSGDLLASNNLSDVASAATARTNLGVGTGDSPQFTAINLGHASDTTLTRVSAGVIAVEGATVATLAGGTFTGDIVVPDEAYDATAWNGSLEVPTKNAVRDKIESLGSAAFRGALVRKAADQTAANYTAITAVTWDQESYDTDTIHDNVTNNTRLTVPSGATYVRVSAAIVLANFSVDAFFGLSIRKNGSATYDGRPTQYTEVGTAAMGATLSSPVLAVTPGDYFEVFLIVETDTSIDVSSTASWFAMEVVR